jgi:hypothetical protein
VTVDGTQARLLVKMTAAGGKPGKPAAGGKPSAPQSGYSDFQDPFLKK